MYRRAANVAEDCHWFIQDEWACIKRVGSGQAKKMTTVRRSTLRQPQPSERVCATPVAACCGTGREIEHIRGPTGFGNQRRLKPLWSEGSPVLLTILGSNARNLHRLKSLVAKHGLGCIVDDCPFVHIGKDVAVGIEKLVNEIISMIR